MGEHVAVLRVLGRLAADLGAPADARISVRGWDSLPLQFSARASRSEPRQLAGGESELVWRALFAVPFAIVQRPGALFELTAAGGCALALPAPGIRGSGQQLQLTPAGDSSRAAGLALRQAVALATAVAVTATSTPALAVADGLTAVATTPVSHAHVTEARIDGLASFAAQRLRRNSAAAKAERSKSHRAASHRSKPHRAKSHRTKPRATRPSPSTSTATKSGPVTAPVLSGPANPNGANGSRANCAPTSSPALRRSELHRSNSATAPAASPAPDLPRSSSCTSHTAQPHGHGRMDGLAPGAASTGATSSAPSGQGGAQAGNSGGVPAGNSGGVPAGNSGGVPAGNSGGVPAGNSGGVPVGNSGGVPAGSGVTPPTTLSPKPVATTGPPRATRVHSEPRSARQLPVVVPRTVSGGAAARHSSGSGHSGPVTLSGTHTGTSAPVLVPSPPGFLGPKSWTGTVTNDPALSGALGDLSNLLSNGNNPPAFLIPIYMEAARRYHVPWEVLAGINSVESDFGRNLSTSSAGAIGWMQFEPSTWHQYGLAADGHSMPNPYDPRDAIFSAARYLAAAGAAQDVSRAIYAYNHAGWYVDMVLGRARSIAANVRPERQAISKRGVVSVFFSTHQRRHPTVRYRGGVMSHYDRLIAAANMVSAANFPYLYGGGHEQPARFGPFDCSGSVSYVMQQAGYKVPTTVSGDVPSWRFPAGPGRVTIFYNPTHTFMRIGNRYFGTSGFARGGTGGAGWFDTSQIPESYLANFSEVQVPRLGVNSFAPRHVKRHRA